MNDIGARIIVAIMGGALGAAAVLALGTNAPAPPRVVTERVVHDYLLANPEILPEAMSRLQERQTAKAIAANRSVIERPFAGAWEGAADGDVTLVEFFDYACGYCRASLADIDRLLREDKRLRIVYREFPVLGPDSESAAMVSLAAAKADKYRAFHRAMFAQGRPDKAAAALAANDLGIDPAIMPGEEALAEITRNRSLQRTLNLGGTPSFVVGNQLLTGAVGYEALKSAIADARAGRG